MIQSILYPMTDDKIDNRLENNIGVISRIDFTFSPAILIFTPVRDDLRSLVKSAAPALKSMNIRSCARRGRNDRSVLWGRETRHYFFSKKFTCGGASDGAWSDDEAFRF